MSDGSEATAGSLNIYSVVKDILNTIEREREREIISRRFGLYDRRETLEQIGELLGITRERVRQLEKAIITKLKDSATKDMPHIQDVEKTLIMKLHEMGRAAPIKSVAASLTDEGNDRDKAHVAFLATLAPGIAVVDENDHYHHSIGISEHHDDEAIRKSVNHVVASIKGHGKPITIKNLHGNIEGYEHPDHVKAFASISKELTNLKAMWGHIKWPTVNPKNIRDKIYVILRETGKPLHFSDIAKHIHGSDFKRKNVTTQAIHNELIKDGRFVLIGRGIYALKEWGYTTGTVADIIVEVLKESGEPMHRDTIVEKVLNKRQVKETTVLLNLQSKPQFKRTKKATYALAD